MSDEHKNSAAVEHHEQAGPSEPDRPPMLKIAGMLVGLTLLVGITMVGLYEYFRYAKREEIQRKQLTPVSRALRELRAKEQALLTRYDQIDAKKGTYQVPVDRAMELLLKRPELLLPTAAPAKAPAKAAAKAAAPASQPASQPAGGKQP